MFAFIFVLLHLFEILTFYSIDVCVDTPLHAAASDGHYEVVEYLLQVGALATINAKSKDGWTATWKGARGGHLEVVRILVSKGADTNLADNEGLTPLNVAAESGHLQVAQVLLDNHADVNQASNGNITPLAAATASSRLAEKPQMAMLLCLLEHGADCNIADSKGKKPIDLARPHIKPFFELTVIDITDRRVMELLSDNDYLLWFLMISVDFTSKLVSDLVKEYPELVEVTDTTGKFRDDIPYQDIPYDTPYHAYLIYKYLMCVKIIKQTNLLATIKLKMILKII